MKKILITGFYILCFISFCYSGEGSGIMKKIGVPGRPVSCRSMTDRLNKAAAIYAKMGQVSRIGVYDFAFAVTLEEYAKLNSYGVIMISAQTRDENELPIKSAYFKTGDKKYRLTWLFSKPVSTFGDAAERLFGKNREDIFYLIPYAFTRMRGGVYIDWNRHRDGFVVAKFPGAMALDFIADYEALLPDRNSKVGPAALARFLAREFSFRMEEQSAAVENARKEKSLVDN